MCVWECWSIISSVRRIFSTDTAPQQPIAHFSRTTTGSCNIGLLAYTSMQREENWTPLTDEKLGLILVGL